MISLSVRTLRFARDLDLLEREVREMASGMFFSHQRTFGSIRGVSLGNGLLKVLFNKNADMEFCKLFFHLSLINREGVEGEARPFRLLCEKTEDESIFLRLPDGSSVDTCLVARIFYVSGQTTQKRFLIIKDEI